MIIIIGIIAIIVIFAVIVVFVIVVVVIGPILVAFVVVGVSSVVGGRVANTCSRTQYAVAYPHPSAMVSQSSNKKDGKLSTPLLEGGSRAGK